MQIPLDDLLPDTKLAFCRTLRYEATKAGSQMVEIHIVLSSEHIEKTISDTVLFVDKWKSQNKGVIHIFILHVRV